MFSFLHALALHATYSLPIFMQQAFISLKTIRRCMSSAASPPAAVSDLNAVVFLLVLTAQHVNITLSSVAHLYSHPPQTQAIMLFTLCQACCLEP